MADMTFKCPECARDLTVDDKGRGLTVACPLCGKQIQIPSGDTQSSTPDVGEFAARVSARISSTVGVEKLEGFSLKEMFSEVFAKHTDEEVERYFAVGGPDTTPPIADVDTSWPKPWVFFRTFMTALIAYIGFVQAWEEFENINLIPGLIMVGSFAVPFATLLFFFEANVRRNVSLFQINKLVFLGGILSLVLSLIMFQVIAVIDLKWLGASVAGLAEEPGKLLALAVIVNNRKYPYILNGLLFGAAVGTGFAAFESAGYALYYALEGGTDSMKDVILTRGMLAPFGHIAWTSMVAAALWRVKGANRFTFSMVKDVRFLRVLIAAVVLHMLWNTNIYLPFYGKFVILGIVAWVIVLGLLQEGLKQLRAEKSLAISNTTLGEVLPENRPVA